MLQVGHPLPSPSVGPPLGADLGLRHARALDAAKKRVRLFVDMNGAKEWRAVVAQPMPPWTRDAPRQRPASRAYFKLLELLRAHPLRGVARSLHVCEAPGGFAQCAADLFPGLDWAVATLGTCAASLDPARVIEADVLQEAKRAELAARFAGVDLVTADGATEMDHDRLEEEALPLLEAQADVALRCLRPGGALVLKLFELADRRTVEVLARLCAAFRCVFLVKPFLSRPTNSERYVVCQGLREGAATTRAGATVGWWEAVRPVVDGMLAEQHDALRAALGA